MHRYFLATLALIFVGAIGCSNQSESPESTTASAAEEISEGPLRYEIEVGTTGFTPAEVQANVGQPVTLVFTRITDETCGTEVVVPSHDIELPLPLNEAVEITLVPDEAGVIDYSCGMEMLLGKIVVN